MGQLRGLNALGLLGETACISSVSGGTWASLLYTFRSADIDINTFLGEVVENPGDLNWEPHDGVGNARDLSWLAPDSLGQVPGRLGIYTLLKTFIELRKKYQYPYCDLWIRAIGKLILEPFGLAEVDTDGNPTQYMGYTSEWIQNNPLKLNPGTLSESDFNAAPVDSLRPYLITNTSIFADQDTLLRYEISAVYQGIGNSVSVSGELFGGGYLDTYAFGSGNPEPPSGSQLKVQQMKTRACLADAAGLSSADFSVHLESLIKNADGDISNFGKDLSQSTLGNEAEAVTDLLQKDMAVAGLSSVKDVPGLGSDFSEFSKAISGLDALIPRFPYWPVGALEQGGTPEAQTYRFADGGSLEYTGIISLLQRSCPVSSPLSTVGTHFPKGMEFWSSTVRSRRFSATVRSRKGSLIKSTKT